MKLLDLSLSSPAENLALDEALLDVCEETGQETLRFWESETPFVVLGYSNKIEEEVHSGPCREDGISVLRRPSGGGTVLQGPGCLNYALALHIPRGANSPLHSVTETNHFIMTRLRVAFAKHLHRPVAIEGHTDLAIEGLKFSGNAQRRKRNALLFHGTFLYAFHLETIERFLKIPTRQPEYRLNRPHSQFVMNLEEDEGTIKSIVSAAWHCGGLTAAPVKIPREAVRRLVEEKYSRDEWNLKF